MPPRNGSNPQLSLPSLPSLGSCNRAGHLHGIWNLYCLRHLQLRRGIGSTSAFCKYLICGLTIQDHRIMKLLHRLSKKKKLCIQYIFMYQIMHFNYTDVDPLIQDFYTDVDPGFSKWKHGRYSWLPTSFFRVVRGSLTVVIFHLNSLQNWRKF